MVAKLPTRMRQGTSSMRCLRTSGWASWQSFPHWRLNCWCTAAGREPRCSEKAALSFGDLPSLSRGQITLLVSSVGNHRWFENNLSNRITSDDVFEHLFKWDVPKHQPATRTYFWWGCLVAVTLQLRMRWVTSVTTQSSKTGHPWSHRPWDVNGGAWSVWQRSLLCWKQKLLLYHAIQHVINSCGIYHEYPWIHFGV